MFILNPNAILNNDEQIVQSGEDVQYFAAANLELDNNLAPLLVAPKIIINAINLRISSNLQIAGSEILIFSKSLEIVGTPVLDVSGSHGKPYQLPARNGTNQGESGTNGGEGASGEDAGSVTITCESLSGGKIAILANGGDGAVGQSGGDGAVGRTAEKQPSLFDHLKSLGSHTSRSNFLRDHLGYPKNKKLVLSHSFLKLITKNFHRNKIKGLAGKNGGKGGDAGKGGTGGNGGQGGQVQIFAPSGSYKHIEFSASAGLGGKQGSVGTPGKGGPKGVGGVGVILRQPASFFPQQKWPTIYGPSLSVANGATVQPVKATDESYWGVDGSTGKDGNSANAAVTGQNGTDGKTRLYPVSAAHIDKKLATEFITLSLQYCKTTFIEGNNQETDVLATWLNEVCGRLLEANSTFQTSDFTSEEEYNQQNSTVEKSRAEAQIIANKISLGLNYFGHSSSFAPRLSVETYREQVSSQIKQIRRLDKDFEDFRADTVDQFRDLSTAQSMVQKLSTDVQNRRTKLKDLRDQVLAIEIILKELLEKSNEYSDALFQADIDFKRAVEKRAKCGFSDILQTVSSLVAIATGVGAVAGAYSLFKQAGEKSEDSSKPKAGEEVKPTPFLEKISKTTGSITGLKTAYDKLKTDLQTQKDTAILIMNKEDFDRELEKFSGIPEAKQYKSLMTEFANTNESRNQNVLRLSEKRQLIASIDTEISKIEDGIKTTLQGALTEFSPQSASLSLLFRELLQSTRFSILENLELQRRSHRYWSLDESSNITLIGNLSSEDLDILQLRVGEEIIVAKEKFGSDRQPLEDNTFTFTRSKYPEKFESIEKFGIFDFNIPSESEVFPFHSRIFVKDVRINVKCAKGRDEVCWLRLLHRGNAEVLDRDRSKHHFSHETVQTQGKNKLDSSDVILPLIDENSDYVGLSPFADWSLRFEHFEGSNGLEDKLETNDEQDQISEISISFEGDYTPTNW